MWRVTVTASQGVVKASVVLIEQKSDTTGGPFVIVDDTYRMDLAPGMYELNATGDGLTSNGRFLGTVSVNPGTTTAVPSTPVPGC